MLSWKEKRKEKNNAERGLVVVRKKYKEKRCEQEKSIYEKELKLGGEKKKKKNVTRHSIRLLILFHWKWFPNIIEGGD